MRVKHLYIHVPFCARRCNYCDFAVHATRRPPIEAWLDGIETELRQVTAELGGVESWALRTLYVGGGTPSLAGGEMMAELRSRIELYARLDELAEWTAEANPESIDAGLARDWHDAGVRRISLGAQTFHDPSLRWMGRLHGPEGPGRAVDAARSAGIENINIDLIFGLPERLGRSWEDDLRRVLALAPDHVSLYGLTAEPGTPLGRRVREGRERMPDDSRYGREYLLAAERLTAAGLRHYEVSNFARPGRESHHNAAYWSGAAYVGLGPGAHSFLPPLRRWNVRDWARWQRDVTRHGRAVEDEEAVDPERASLERVWLGLQTADGLELADLDAGQIRHVGRWENAGWCRSAGGRVSLTAEGWLLLDRLAVELDAAGADSPLHTADVDWPLHTADVDWPLHTAGAALSLDAASGCRDIQVANLPDAGLHEV